MQTECATVQNSTESLLIDLPKRISVMVQPMNGGEEQLVYSDAAIFTADGHKVLFGMSANTPHPTASGSKR